MAERSGVRRRSRRDSTDTAGSVRGTPPASRDRRTKRSSKPSKERWLLTRKTWRYMADAGRRLIPDGTHNRPEDIPKIEQYFQEVCQREPRFLLWRKASYPGTLGFRSQRRRRLIKGGSCRTKASSADEADDARSPPRGFVLQTTTAGKFDLAKAKREWLLASEGGSTPSSPVERRKFQQEDAEAKALADMLQKYLNMQSDVAGTTKTGGRSEISGQAEGKEPFDYQSLIDKLQQHLDLMVAHAKLDELSVQRSTSDKDVQKVPKSMQPYQGDYVHKSLMETISRYYSKSGTRERVISDILTDRKLLEKLYFDLRCTRGFRGPRATGAYTSPSSRWWTHQRTRLPTKETEDWLSTRRDPNRDPFSPPPLIAVQEPSTDRGPIDDGVQTDPVPREVLDAILLEREKEESSKESSSQKSSGRRRSSVDNDDVSPSVSDTIKRYLRMARKKSMDADKVDRFKRVNYDRNLRNIKAKGETTKLSDDDGNNKGCQTEDTWAVNYREMSSMENPFENLSDADTTTSPPSRNASSRSSIDAGLGSEEPLTPKHHHQSFLSHLLHGSNAHKDKPHSAPGSPALTSSSTNSAGGTAMQKSKSSSSVVHHGSRLVAKKIWRSRSKSTSRASNQPSVWTPQGKCMWAGTAGRRVTLQDTPLRSLSEVERKVLCKVAVAKLQALNLGVHIRPPSESLGSSAVATKPKRRAPLLKRKALTTGFFDNKGKDDKEKDSSGGLVFGIPLSQCLENDRIARIAAGEVADVGCLSRSSRHGSRTSFTSLIEPTVAAKTDEGGSCESLSSKGGALTGSDSGVLELSDSGGGGPPGEWDAVPAVVRQCIRHLETSGLRTLGVFRVSPSKKRVRQLREDFDCGRETKIGPDQCPHDVAALLKEYFRDLPDPLLCRDLYQAFVHTQKIRNRRLQQEALQHLIQLLPTPNRETLWALLNFLSVVAANSDDQKTDTGEWIPGNKMDTTNLATVFAPNILHCVKPGQRSEVSAERAEERIDVINVVRALLEHATTLFTVPAALLDEVYHHMMDTHPAELDLALSRRADEQCGDEADPCSEAETFSVEETLTTSTTTTAGTTTSTRKVWTREQCLHQTAGIGGDIGPRPRRSKRPGSRRKEEGRSNSVDSGSSEDPADPRRKSSPMVITASLTIPMSGAFTLNLDDPDIPYIEEAPKQPSVPPRRQRQRSISGCSEGGRHGSDSAVGSSATLSGDQAPSSPPSWASSPPASPDSAVTAVSYIPDQQAVLQRVSFTTSSEVRQVARSNNQETSRSTAAPYTPSITSIGGAVLRSKTADIERMLHISRPDMLVSQQSKTSSSTSSDSKKYTKRRYTDSRHQTRHIPDSDTLAGKTAASVASSPSVAMSTSSSVIGGQSQRAGAQPVWKRRELISSAPKDRERYF
ncbi:rho GTPase activating protein at 102A isoform X1 [Colletes latitarsis]|uniref:rho GTPase activating protein at 102A isoform X1 n=1 Tax=Colletes latitarsis TaxID=2605962 RepID=UPI004036B31A